MDGRLYFGGDAMDYPLIIDGIDAGTLSVSEEGLYTCFEARAGERDGLVRLWVCGGGECAYLGVMQPWSGGLYLRRRLSRRELKGCGALVCSSGVCSAPPSFSGSAAVAGGFSQSIYTLTAVIASTAAAPSAVKTILTALRFLSMFSPFRPVCAVCTGGKSRAARYCHRELFPPESDFITRLHKNATKFLRQSL